MKDLQPLTAFAVPYFDGAAARGRAFEIAPLHHYWCSQAGRVKQQLCRHGMAMSQAADGEHQQQVKFDHLKRRHCQPFRLRLRILPSNLSMNRTTEPALHAVYRRPDNADGALSG